MNIKNYHAPKKDLWEGRCSDSGDEYFHEHVILVDVENNALNFEPCKGIAIIGFCCDAGVIRNQGRPGAMEGPDAIRKNLAKFSWQLDNLKVYDLGNVLCIDDELEDAQRQLAKVVSFAQKNNFLPIVLGGGHETAWGHYQGIRQVHPTKNLSIINFDAHFDLRELLENGQGSSGTPFLQIARDCSDRDILFNYFVLGIQDNSNIKSLFETADNLGVDYVKADALLENSVKTYEAQLKTFLEKGDGLYLTFCLDVMSQAIAPGVSAPQANGLFMQQILPLLKIILQQEKLLSFDIVELAPSLDQDNATSRLAANIVYELLKQW